MLIQPWYFKPSATAYASWQRALIFLNVYSRWKAASLGSDPQSEPGQWSQEPQKTLDPPLCSSGGRKGVHISTRLGQYCFGFFFVFFQPLLCREFWRFSHWFIRAWEVVVESFSTYIQTHLPHQSYCRQMIKQSFQPNNECTARCNNKPERMCVVMLLWFVLLFFFFRCVTFPAVLGTWWPSLQVSSLLPI